MIILIIIAIAGLGIMLYSAWFIISVLCFLILRLFIKDFSKNRFFSLLDLLEVKGKSILYPISLIPIALLIGFMGFVFAYGMGKAIFQEFQSNSDCYSDCPNNDYGVPRGN